MKEKDIEKKIENAVDATTKSAKKSFDNLTTYAQENPVQGALLGIAAYFAIKGVIGTLFK